MGLQWKCLELLGVLCRITLEMSGGDDAEQNMRNRWAASFTVKL